MITGELLLELGGAGHGGEAGVGESLPVRGGGKRGAYRRAFLKWAGGKSQMLKSMLPLFPKGRRIVEPFAGSAVVSLNAGMGAALVCDSNADLIDVYLQLQSRGEEFIAEAKELFTPQFNTEAAFYALREEFNSGPAPSRKAALFIYLNRHGFNGLCRYNASGRFNVPYGKYKGPGFPEQELRGFHAASSRMEFRAQPFQQTFQQQQPGDVYFCDPPYVPLSKTASFTAYSTGGFSMELQTELAELARKAAAAGGTVLISNHDTAFTREIYAGAELIPLQIQRSISCKGEQRGAVGEILAVFRPGGEG